MKEHFKKKGVNLNNITWIDAISKTLKNIPSQTEGCYNVSSPGALTELSLTISKFIKHKFDYIVIDSVNNLLIYRDKTVVIKFLVDLVSKLEGNNTNLILHALAVKEQEGLIREISTFVDKVIKIKD